jgi:hypothetical protein
MRPWSGTRDEATQEDLAILVQKMKELPDPSSHQQPLHIETEVSEEEIKNYDERLGDYWEITRDEWVKVRLNMAIAGQCTAAIDHGGAIYFLTSCELYFNESGVMIM